MTLQFYKFDGAGNDFVVVDNRSGQYQLSTDEIARLCHRRFGIGADGLMTLDSTDAEGVHEWTRGKEQTGIQDEAFIHAVRTGDRSQILADYSEAVKSLRLTLACNESIETGRTIFFN